MKITDFEDDFDDKVLTRGYAYYKDGAILSVEPSEDNEDEYLAEVEGSEIYNVCIEVTPSGEIAFAACDCPYDYGYCKHIAAVLYHIRDMKKHKKKLPKTTEKLSDLISKCSKKQLEEIILEHANKDKSFKNYLKMMLSESNDINKYISDFKRIAHRFFSGDNCDIDELCKSADILISKAEKRNSAAEIVNACTSIISIFQTEMADSYIDTDEAWDFNCELDICEAKIYTTAQDVIESGNKKLTAEIWSLLINNWVDDDEYWGNDIIFLTLMEFAAIPEYRQKLEEKLISMKINASEYTVASIDKKLYKIVESYGSKDDTDNIYKQ
ncbi:MAG: SWIM zinc finger domain-containing protein [Oscillospiraceae bacterium]